MEGKGSYITRISKISENSKSMSNGFKKGVAKEWAIK